jgi:NTP pyrophosphatase (non-canonical NTP hydrolase)
MTPNEYQQLALRTEKGLKDKELHLEPDVARLMHAAVGCCTEAGELQDALKKRLFYDQPRAIDRVNIIEEFGDLLWYVAIGLDSVGSTIEEAMEKNISKLVARYPDGFTSADAKDRDLNKERAILEAE